MRFRPDARGVRRATELTEVKHSKDFKKYEEKFAARFATATAFAGERGRIFVKKDESHIRTPRLQVAYFLRASRRHTPTDEHRNRLFPDTRLMWAVRSAALTRVFGGGDADALPARGQLGSSLRALREIGRAHV